MEENARRFLATELFNLMEVRQVAKRLKIEAAIDGLADGKGGDQVAFSVRSQTVSFWHEVDLFDSSIRVELDGKSWEVRTMDDVMYLVVRLKREYHLRWYS